MASAFLHLCLNGCKLWKISNSNTSQSLCSFSYLWIKGKSTETFKILKCGYCLCIISNYLSTTLQNGGIEHSTCDKLCIYFKWVRRRSSCNLLSLVKKSPFIELLSQTAFSQFIPIPKSKTLWYHFHLKFCVILVWCYPVGHMSCCFLWCIAW